MVSQGRAWHKLSQFLALSRIFFPRSGGTVLFSQNAPVEDSQSAFWFLSAFETVKRAKWNKIYCISTTSWCLWMRFIKYEIKLFGNYQNGKSQNLRLVEAEDTSRSLWSHPAPAGPLKAGAQHHLQAASEDLQRGDPTASLGLCDSALYPNLLVTHCLVQPRAPLAFFLCPKTHCWLKFNLVTIGTSRSFSVCQHV